MTVTKAISRLFIINYVLFLSACNSDIKQLEADIASPEGAVTAREISVNIIPEPQQLKIKSGQFQLTAKTKIIASKAEMQTALYLQNYLEQATGVHLNITNKPEMDNVIIFQRKQSLQKDLADEGYKLVITSDNIIIEAAGQAGLFYGVQSLRHLLPAEVEQQNKNIALNFKLPNIEVLDKPKYPWRAFMLDEARFFQGKAEVFKLMDQMALLKMNTFHWHLTDHEGWRLEIKQYPKLTSVGSYRKDSQSGATQEWLSKTSLGEAHSGFYSQEDIKEVLEYADKLHITVIPEIEMPGHSAAAIAAYPWLGTDTKEIEVPTRFGKHKPVYNVADPKVIQFNKNVLDETIALFPSQIIHIGGDEVLFDHWKASAQINDFMKEKSITNYGDLQVSFTNEISQYINSKGRRMMGWNDILGGNIHDWQASADVETTSELAKNSVIHFWKGDKALLTKALEQGYEVVSSVHSSTYLDYTYEMISLEKAYKFNPIPTGLSTDYQAQIIGITCHMWGEFIPTATKMENLIYPRIAAYAEVAWTEPSKKNYQHFGKKLLNLQERWDVQNIAYHSANK